MNPNDSFFKRLEGNSRNYSRSQNKLARFILKDYQKIAFMTIKEFARASGISEATILRFTLAMGFKGYPSFQKEIRRIVRAELKGTERFRIVNSHQGKDFNLLLNVMNKEIENISHLQEMFLEDEFKKTIRAIRSASETVVIGTRSTASLAFHFWFGLTKLGIRAVRITSLTTESYDFINRLDSQALVIVIGFPRYLREWVEVFHFAKEKGLRTLTLTDSRFSPLIGDINLYCSAESSSFIAFHCAPLILINTIITGLSLEDREKTLSELDRFERMAEARNYFIRA